MLLYSALINVNLILELFKFLISQGISSLCTLLPSKNRKQTPIYMQKRNLAVHEYIALDILKEAGITVPRGGVARTPDEALKIAQSLGKYTINFY